MYSKGVAVATYWRHKICKYGDPDTETYFAFLVIGIQISDHLSNHVLLDFPYILLCSSVEFIQKMTLWGPVDSKNAGSEDQRVSSSVVLYAKAVRMERAGAIVMCVCGLQC
ncbi:hypothetical protein M8J77_006556 [Diaphorina citri]|nr:hypothetical protein M8J77_006556 [Diaphorina citri]